MVPAVTDGETTRGTPQPSSEEVLEQLQKLLASRPLRESHQLQSFLEHIVRETLDGHSDGLKEYLLGCRVFGRKPDYDPRHDGIVRVQATALRKRLERYYLEDGAHDRILIDLPRGGYIPSFRYSVAAPPESPEPAVAPLPSAPPPRPSRASWAIAFATGCILTLAATLLYVRLNRPSNPAADFPQLWKPFTQPGVTDLIAYGVPLFFSADGLYVRDVEVNVQDQAPAGRIRQFAEAFKLNPQPQDDIYTGVGEVEATHRISNFLATRGIAVRVTNARTLGRSEIAGHNLIVVSSLRFQTLLRDLHLPADFEFLPQRPETILNLHPSPGEDREYVFSNGAGISTSYALVSVWPGLTPDTRIAHIGGVHTWATQAATEFMLQPEELRKISARFKSDESPYFQILLRVEGRGNQPHRIEYVTHHYLHR